MMERSGNDRRVRNIKVAKDNRKGLRRKEDIDNSKSYYFMVSFMGCLLFSVGLISYVLS